MAAEVSGMSSEKQLHFRRSMEKFVQVLIADIDANLQAPIEIDRDDIVINHYQNLGDQALVIEGFVDTGSTSLAFKALLDLNDPSQTLVFVPANQDPTDQDLATLDAMSARIAQLGGDPLSADQEPTQAVVP
jgi:hypothetical protein